jgi:hypothetical protein
MTLYQSYKKNQYKKYFSGGPIQEEQATLAVAGKKPPPGNEGFAQSFGFGASVASGILDATSKPDPTTGRTSTGVTIGKSALSGAAAGAALGPVGALAGGVVGAGLGLINARKEKREAKAALNAENNATFASDSQRSAAMLATNPELATGYKSNYFALGGVMSDPGPGKKAGSLLEISRANAEAKRFAKARNLINPENVYAARKVGDELPQYLTPDRKAFNPEAGVAFKSYIPPQVTRDDIQMGADGIYTYPDPNTGDLVPVNTQALSLPRFKNQGSFNTKASTINDINAGRVAMKANGGTIDAPLSRTYMNGGYAKTLSSDGTEMVGRSHAEGGIDVPGAGAELEGNETTKGNFVFSDRLGFASQHKKLAKAKGIIEGKPATAERLNSIKLLSAREDKLASLQELLKRQMN